MIIVYFFKYIKYRLHRYWCRNCLYNRTSPLSLKDYIRYSRYFHLDCKALQKAYKIHIKSTKDVPRETSERRTD